MIPLKVNSFNHMKNVLIDSDVILDFFLDREPFCKNASLILSLCEKKKIKGLLTPLIVSNVFYMLRKISKREIVIARLKELISFVDIAEINKQVVIDSLNSDFSDFEDALQNYAAEQSRKIDAIITRNTKDYKHSSLNVLTPTEFLKIF